MRIFALLLCSAALAAAAGRDDATDLFNKVEPANELELISKGKQAAELLLKAIRSNAFHAVLDLIGVAGGPIAGTVTSILKVVIGKNSNENEDLKFVREAFAEINNKLEAFTNEFREIKSLIDWNAIQVSYGTYERAIRALKQQLQLLVEAPAASVDDLRQQFIIKYESGFQNAADKIYDGIVNNDMIFSKNLLEASAKYTANHRRQVQMFSMGLTQLLLQAVEIQIAYFDLKYANHDTTDYIKTTWNNRMAALKAKMRRFDELLTTRFEMQMPKDAQQLIRDNQQLPSSDLTLKLFYVMEEKFYWREFAIVVYDAVDTSAYHAITHCQVYISLQEFGKNVVVASAKKSQTIFDPDDAAQLVESLKPTEKNAGHIMELMNAADSNQSCSKYQLKMVVDRSANVRAGFLGSRGVKEEICVSSFWGTTCYWAILFG